MTTARIACKHCGGTVGTLSDGAHTLCSARARRGVPTPSLGAACATCPGTGARRATAMDATNASTAQLRRAYDCRACNGTGKA